MILENLNLEAYFELFYPLWFEDSLRTEDPSLVAIDYCWYFLSTAQLVVDNKKYFEVFFPLWLEDI